jgi:hypothetical protein
VRGRTAIHHKYLAQLAETKVAKIFHHEGREEHEVWKHKVRILRDLRTTILKIFRSLRKFFEPGPSLPLRHSGESRNPAWVVVRETGSP